MGQLCHARDSERHSHAEEFFVVVGVYCNGESFVCHDAFLSVFDSEERKKKSCCKGLFMLEPPVGI